MKILVTGAFGNIGRHTVPLLLARGHQVRALSERGSAADLKAASAWRGAGEVFTCEGLVTGSGLDWLIFRFADVPMIALRQPIPMMFRIPLATRIEMIHPDDAALALANAVDNLPEWRRILLIGGGARCQLTYDEY